MTTEESANLRKGERPVDILLAFVEDPRMWIGSRIDAAGQLLISGTPANYVEAAKGFLLGVANSGDLGDDVRVAALKVMRKAESRKDCRSIQSSNRTFAFARARRRVELHAAGLWPLPGGWADDITLPEDGSAPSNFAQVLRAARERLVP